MKPLRFAVCLLCSGPLLPGAAVQFTATLKGPKAEPVADAVVSLTPSDGTAVPAPKQSVEIGQQNQEFSAYVTAVQAGTTIVFPNKDTVQHHVYSLSKAKKFELPLYNPGQAESFVFDTPGLVTLGCNIHDWMLAYIVIVPTPYFGKSDATGAVTVAAPPGRYRLEIWHPRQKTSLVQEVTLAEGADVKREFTLELGPDRRIRRALTTKSSGY